MKTTAVFLIFFSFAAASAQAKSYYFAQDGDDTTTGDSLAAPWQHFSKLQGLDLKPGDEIVLDSESTFTDTLILDASHSGSAEKPVKVRASGPGKATLIRRGRGNPIEIHGTSHVAIENLDIVGPGFLFDADPNRAGNGILIENSDRGRHPRDLTLRDVAIRGFRTTAVDAESNGNGFLLSNRNEAPGYEDVRIDGVRTQDNSYAGIQVRTMDFLHRHRAVRILNCGASYNEGVRDMPNDHSGHGIMVKGVNKLEIADSLAEQNGALNAADANYPQGTGGSVGIGVWDSSEVYVHDNAAIANKTGASSGGGGFDIDGGVVDAVVENNFSMDNDGPGFLASAFEGGPPIRRTVFRNNVSLNDAQKANGYGSLTTWGDVQATFERNLVLLTRGPDNGLKALWQISPDRGAIWFQGNAFLLNIGDLVSESRMGPLAPMAHRLRPLPFRPWPPQGPFGQWSIDPLPDPLQERISAQNAVQLRFRLADNIFDLSDGARDAYFQSRFRLLPRSNRFPETSDLLRNLGRLKALDILRKRLASHDEAGLAGFVDSLLPRSGDAHAGEGQRMLGRLLRVVLTDKVFLQNPANRANVLKFLADPAARFAIVRDEITRGLPKRIRWWRELTALAPRGIGPAKSQEAKVLTTPCERSLGSAK